MVLCTVSEVYWTRKFIWMMKLMHDHEAACYEVDGLVWPQIECSACCQNAWIGETADSSYQKRKFYYVSLGLFLALLHSFIHIIDLSHTRLGNCMMYHYGHYIVVPILGNKLHLEKFSVLLRRYCVDSHLWGLELSILYDSIGRLKLARTSLDKHLLRGRKNTTSPEYWTSLLLMSVT